MEARAINKQLLPSGVPQFLHYDMQTHPQWEPEKRAAEAKAKR